VKFDQHNIFPVNIDSEGLKRWLTESIQFTILHRSPKNKKVSFAMQETRLAIRGFNPFGFYCKMLFKSKSFLTYRPV